MKILAVDDDPIALEFLSFVLGELGYEYATARSGDEARRLAATGDFQLVISDWEMPGISGTELCRAIRGMALPTYTYFLLLTARDRAQNVVAALDAGVDDVITKPFNPDELLGRVRAAERVLALETRDLMIFALAKLAESRDPDTGAHLERVRNYARVLAQQLRDSNAYPGQIDPALINVIYETSPLHDIGKVAIPDHVLLKRGKLTEAEFDIMKQHPTIGAQTLAALVEKNPGALFLRVAREIAESHHERWDGAGYPRGLVGEQIPLPARIVAVADVYDALTSQRCYKPAFDHAKARSIIVEASGTQFDPRVVEAFVRVEARFVEIRSRYADDTREMAEMDLQLLAA